MIHVVQAAVNGRNTGLRLAAAAPELGHVNFTGAVGKAGVPGDDAFAETADVLHHFRHKAWIMKLHLIGSDVQVG